jgi:hypothetical protein
MSSGLSNQPTSHTEDLCDMMEDEARTENIIILYSQSELLVLGLLRVATLPNPTLCNGTIGPRSLGVATW